MQSKDENIDRRGSLAISALLNEDTIDPLKQQQSSDDLSPILSSGTISPVMGGGGSQLSKAKRKRISPAQYNRLMEIFDQTDTPSSEIRENLAEELDMTKREVQVWFQNRRAKMNRTKNLHNSSRHRHSLIPHSVSNSIHNNNNNSIGFYQVKHRRASAYPVLENNNINKMYKQPQLPPTSHHPQQPLSNAHYPIAPMPQLLRQHHPYKDHNFMHSNTPPPLPPPPAPQLQHQQHYQRKPSAIDLLASAAEYVRTDSKEMTYSRT